MTTPAPVRRLTSLYITSLSVVAILAIAGQWLIQRQLDRQAMDLHVIDTIRQRQSLCQKVLRTALSVDLLPEMAQKQEHLPELRQSLNEWKASAQEIRNALAPVMSQAELGEVKPVMGRTLPAAQIISDRSEEILTRAESQNRRSRPSDRVQNRGVGREFFQAEAEYIRGTDEMIQWYSQKVTANVQHLKFLEHSLLGLTLGVLAIEGALIFRPAVAKLKNTLMALGQSLQETQEKSQQLAVAQEKSEKLLLNILPEPIADRLKEREQAIADGFGDVTVLFADIVGFTQLSSRLSPHALVHYLNEIFSRFDALAETHGLEKIKTIGDAYMVVSGVPNPRSDHACAIAAMALDMQREIKLISETSGEAIDIRIGINSGPVVAGVIGIKKFIYDLWGDTVNVASRMESHGQSGQIHVSDATYLLLKDQFQLEPRGMIHIKGKGDMMTYWLRGDSLRLTEGQRASLPEGQHA